MTKFKNGLPVLWIPNYENETIPPMTAARRQKIVNKTAFAFGKLSILQETEDFLLADMKGEEFRLEGG